MPKVQTSGSKGKAKKLPYKKKAKGGKKRGY
jgi:hypothetical protein